MKTTSSLFLHVSNPSNLEEVASEGVSGALDRLVSTRDPAASRHDVVLFVETWRGEVVVSRVDLEALERVEEGLGPLPHVSIDVVEVTLFDLIHWTRGEVLQTDVCIRLCVHQLWCSQVLESLSKSHMSTALQLFQ
ncbi:Hypothetical_protein [Hexamita inflata]|uniref:Hypothetical_protein n=1 Tax=Hexamita inflata TaxID=28002 RepID=A0ABP1GUG0_9EUKA